MWDDQLRTELPRLSIPATHHIPHWETAVDELFFCQDATLMTSNVTLGESFSSETPQRLFDQPGRREGYAVSSDGTQFLVSVGNPDAMVREIHVVLNWHQELLERVPVP